MAITNIGNDLFQATRKSLNSLFNQGEIAQLTYAALTLAMQNYQALPDQIFEVTYPVGFRPDKTTVLSAKNYSKDELKARYEELALSQLPINGLLQIVTIIDAWIGDILRVIVTRYPEKLGAKRSITLKQILESKSIDDVHLRATDSFLNELAYKSPTELAKELTNIVPFNLLECHAFHKYIEIKATRDIYIHNRGIVNETYLRKADSHSRAKDGQTLPVDVNYFLESYESCIQLIEWVEEKLHDQWHSSEREIATSKPQNEGQKSIEMSNNPEASAPLIVKAKTAKSSKPRQKKKTDDTGS